MRHFLCLLVAICFSFSAYSEDSVLGNWYTEELLVQSNYLDFKDGIAGDLQEIRAYANGDVGNYFTRQDIADTFEKIFSVKAFEIDSLKKQAGRLLINYFYGDPIFKKSFKLLSPLVEGFHLDFYNIIYNQEVVFDKSDEKIKDGAIYVDQGIYEVMLKQELQQDITHSEEIFARDFDRPHDLANAISDKNLSEEMVSFIIDPKNNFVRVIEVAAASSLSPNNANHAAYIEKELSAIRLDSDYNEKLNVAILKSLGKAELSDIVAVEVRHLSAHKSASIRYAAAEALLSSSRHGLINQYLDMLYIEKRRYDKALENDAPKSFLESVFTGPITAAQKEAYNKAKSNYPRLEAVFKALIAHKVSFAGKVNVSCQASLL